MIFWTRKADEMVKSLSQDTFGIRISRIKDGKVYASEQVQAEMVAVDKETGELVAEECDDDAWRKVDWTKCEQIWLLSDGLTGSRFPEER